jgi:hypothetical protein
MTALFSPQYPMQYEWPEPWSGAQVPGQPDGDSQLHVWRSWTNGLAATRATEVARMKESMRMAYMVNVKDDGRRK